MKDAPSPLAPLATGRLQKSTGSPRATDQRSGTTQQRPLAVGVKQAAKMLGIGKNTMYAAVASGKIPHVKLGTRILIPVARLEHWLEENTQHGDSSLPGNLVA